MAKPVPSIVVAGGGPAALEGLLTLRERLDGQHARLTLVAPEQTFGYRPLSTISSFSTGPTHELPLAEVAAAVGADLVSDGVALVAEDAGALLTHDGDWLPFDSLLLAVGARDRSMPRGWLPWHRDGDPDLLRELASEVASGQLRDVGIVIPASTGWPLPGYELALILAWAARLHGSDTRVSLLAADEEPLSELGPSAISTVAAELDRAGVDVRTATPVAEPPFANGNGMLDVSPASQVYARLRAEGQREAPPQSPRLEALVGGKQRSFDRLIALPSQIGPGIGGLGVDDNRYFEVDEHGKLAGCTRVWAAGDCAFLPLKHSTLAVAQADAAADALAAANGADCDARPFRPALHGILVAGAAAQWWAENMASRASHQPVATHCLWWPPGMVVGRRLSRFIARRDPASHASLPWHPHGLPVARTFAAPQTHGAPAPAGTPTARLEDAAERQARALRRLEREADARAAQLARPLRRLEERHANVIRELRGAGYVRST